MLATTLRPRDGQCHIHDGPFADSKEQLGGFIAIEAPYSTWRWDGRHAAQGPRSARSKSAPASLRELDAMAATLPTSLPWWATRAHVLGLLGEAEAAREPRRG